MKNYRQKTTLNIKFALLIFLSISLSLTLSISLIHFFISVCKTNHYTTTKSDIDSLINYDESSANSFNNFIVNFSADFANL